MGQTLELKLEGLINNVIFKSEGAFQTGSLKNVFL